MPRIQGITACLWFDTQAEEAARFYTSIFPNSKVGAITRYGEAGREFHRREPGTALTVAFELDGHQFTALNGGPQYKFTEAISFQVMCETQADVDYFWEKLSAGGDPKSQQCAWLKDKYGVSWQVVPTVLMQLLSDPDTAKAGRVMTAMMGMKKIDITGLQKAAAG